MWIRSKDCMFNSDMMSAIGLFGGDINAFLYMPADPGKSFKIKFNLLSSLDNDPEVAKQIYEEMEECLAHGNKFFDINLSLRQKQLEKEFKEPIP